MQDRSDVVVTDIQMPFGSMVAFMVKWTLASIPAALIVLVLVAILAGMVGGFLGGIF